LIDPTEEEKTGDEKEELNIDEYMVKRWKRTAYGARTQHL
jgi:hypothetical protein